MANTRTEGTDSAGQVYFQEASVDTDPGAEGYGCTPVTLRTTVGGMIKQMVFYVKSMSVADATVTLQWQRYADTSWTDYNEYTEVCRYVINDVSNNVYWRAIIKSGDRGTGTTVFGIDW